MTWVIIVTEEEPQFSYKDTSTMSYQIKKGEAPKFRIIADLHYGEPDFDMGCFLTAISEAEEEGRKVILLGDLITSIIPEDRRFEKDNHKIDFAEQLDWLERILHKYADTIHLVFQGNHEQKLIRTHGDFIEKICERNAIMYAGYQMNILYRKLNYKNKINFYLTHGNRTFNYRAGEGRRIQTNKEVRIKDLLEPTCEADLYVMGHAHQGVLSTDALKMKLVNETGKRYEEKYVPENQDKVFCCCPSMFRTYQGGENYGTRSGFIPSEVGFIDVNLTKGLEIDDVKLIVSNGDEFIEKDSYKRRRRLVSR